MSGQSRSLGKSTLVIGGLIVIAALAAVQFGVVPGVGPLIKGAGASAHAPKPAAGATKAPALPPDPALAQQQQLLQQQADLQTRDAALKQKETQVTDTLTQLNQQKAAGDAVKRVADMYAAMSASKAAPLVQTLSLDEAVAILRLMDQDQAAAILAAMPPARGSQLTSLLLKPQPQTPAQIQAQAQPQAQDQPQAQAQAQPPTPTPTQQAHP